MENAKFIESLLLIRKAAPARFADDHLRGLKKMAGGEPNYSLLTLIREAVVIFAADCNLPLAQNTNLLEKVDKFLASKEQK